MIKLINLQREAWSGYEGGWYSPKRPTVSANTSDIELGKVKVNKMKAFIDGFKKGLFGTWRFMGENASVLMLFFSIIEYFRHFYILSIHSLLVAILFAIWDLKDSKND